MKNHIVVAALVLVTGRPFASAQECMEVEWTDNFDTMGAGGTIILQQPCFPICDYDFSWQSWEMLAGHANAEASDLFSNSAPISAEIIGDADPALTDRLLHTFTDLNIVFGEWKLATMVYVPADMTGVSFFRLLNTYDRDHRKNTSAEVKIDGDRDVVETSDGSSVPLVRGAWVALEAIISIRADQFVIRYGGAPVGAWRPWSPGIVGGGDDEFHAVELTGGSGPNVAGPVYYDDWLLCRLPPLGACCFRTDPCIEWIAQDVCLATQADAVFQGDGSLCADANCPGYGPNGWAIDDLLTAEQPPFVWEGDTCNDFPGTSECGLQPSAPDQAWTFTIPWAGTWTFSTCGSADFDTALYGSATGTCADDGPFNDDCVRMPGETDSEFSVYLDPDVGDAELFLTLEGLDAQCGPYELLVGARCEPVVTTPYMELLGPCNDPDAENGGCFNDPPVFTEIMCGETFGGSVGISTRTDFDWFRLALDSDKVITLTAQANFPGIKIYLVQLNDDPGAGEDECTDAGFIITETRTNSCIDENGDRPFAVAGMLASPGLYAPIITTTLNTPLLPPGLGGVPCGDEVARYEFTLSCADHCVPSPDVNGDGCVNFADLLVILANWSGAGPGDADCSGGIGFADILAVLSGWGQPPPPSILCAPLLPGIPDGDPEYRSALAAATGGPVDFINGGLTPPSVTMMQRYTAVHVWADRGYSSTEFANRLGARLKAYLDAGGCVILGTGAASAMRFSELFQVGVSPVQRRGAGQHFVRDGLASFDPTSCAYRGVAGEIATDRADMLELLGEGVTVDGIYPNLEGPPGLDGEIGLAYHGTDPKGASPRIFYANGSGGTPSYFGDAGLPAWIASIVAECHASDCP